MYIPNSSLYLIILVLLPLIYASRTYNRNGGVQVHEAIAKTITVDKQGQGDFTSVQKAIDSIPPNNKVWTNIRVKAGIYTEKVTIPQNKPFIVLSGESSRTTWIQWGEAGSSIMSAAFILNADNFVAVNITFKNTYNLVIPADPANHRILWAPAALIYADKASFYNCGFLGVQDTLTDAGGRHFFSSCYISGAVDFIWGSGQSLYERCVLNATTSILNGGAGYITAQARDSPKKTDGFVFESCEIVGNGPVYLGRAYREYSRVLFKNSYMSNIVRPEGWSAWNNQGHEDSIAYSEVDCIGPGANKTERVKWEKNFTHEEFSFLRNTNSFINKDGWIQKQPKIY